MKILLCLFVPSSFPAIADADIEGDVNTFAAIAYSKETGKYGYAYGYRTVYGVRKAAIKECGAKDAKVICHVKYGFCALAIGDDKSAYGWGTSYGNGANTRDAERRALAECRKRTKNARIVVVLSNCGKHRFIRNVKR